MNGTELRTLLCALAVVLAVTLFAGCTRQQPAQPPVGPTPGPAAKAPAPAKPEGMTGKNLAEALAAVNRPQSFEETITQPDGKTQTMLVKDDYNLVRMTTDNGFMQMDTSKGLMYMYDQAQNTATKMKMTGKETDATHAQAKNPMEGVDQKVPIVGEEELDGVKCWTAETTTAGAAGAQKGKMWVLSDSGLLRRMDIGGKVTDFKYSRINELTDADFGLPAGCKIQDMSAMMR